MTRSIINKGPDVEPDVTLADPDQFLVDCYVQCEFIITEKKDAAIIEGFLYKFTACTDAGIPVMDVYQNESGDVKEIKLSGYSETMEWE